MREVSFLNPHSPVVAKAVSLMKARGEVGVAAARYLEARVENQELVTRSFEMYNDVLDLFSTWCVGDKDKSNRLTLQEAVTDSTIAGFLSSLKHKRVKQRLARQVLRHFVVSIGRHRPASLQLPLAQVEHEGESVLLSREISPSAAVSIDGEQTQPRENTRSRIPTVAHVSKIDEEVEYILNSAAGMRGAHTADTYTIMRAAAVAFCRYGGAVASDIAGMKFRDVLMGKPIVEMTATDLEDFWLALRPRRTHGRTGLDRFKEVQILYGSRAKLPIVAWINHRVLLAETLDEAAPLFIVPETGAPLNRRVVWRLVSGLPLKEGDRRKGAPKNVPRSQRAKVKDRENPILISPSLLRHALGLSLLDTLKSGEELSTLLQQQMGVSQRGIASEYRSRMLRLVDDSGVGLDKAPSSNELDTPLSMAI
jgi:hypothetical protein